MSNGERLLQAWERAATRSGAAREAALLGREPRSLAERNRLALDRYAEFFGAPVELTGRCAHCATEVELAIDATQCAAALPPAQAGHDDGGGWYVLPGDGDGTRFRLPLPSDLHALQDIDDDVAFADALLDRCVEGAAPAGQAQREAIVQRMQELQPAAALEFSLRCPACGQTWTAPLDPVDLLWRVLRSQAERLLAEIAVLARRFGWSERDVLALGPVRRAAYLQLAEA